VKLEREMDETMIKGVDDVAEACRYCAQFCAILPQFCRNSAPLSETPSPSAAR